MSAPMLAPVDPRGTVLGDEVFLRIGQAIIDGTLRPGEHLRDHELARRLDVSRTPVREALQRLERSGLVEVAPNKYTRVSIPNAKALADTHVLIITMLGSAARLAVRACTDEQLRELLSHFEPVVAASRADDRVALLAASTEFFRHLTKAADNSAILRVLREGELAMRRSVAGWSPPIACPVERTGTYEAFGAALAARDADGAERALRAVHGLD